MSQCLDCSAPAIEGRARCEDHLGRCREASRRHHAKQTPEEIRRKNLLRTYGMTVEEYDSLLAAQNGVCAICGAADNYHHSGRLGRLCVDHDHETGAIRGILCSHCNRGLGMLKDNPDILDKAAAYLRGTI